LAGATVSTAGTESYGLFAQNAGMVTTIGTTISTAEQAGFGAFAYNAGNILIHGGTITTHGEIFDHPEHGNVGAFGVLSKKGSAITLGAGTQITTYGALAEGLRAEAEDSVASIIVASDTTIRTHGQGAHGIGVYGTDIYDYVNSPKPSLIELSKSSINVTGADSSGVFLEGQSKVTLKGVTIESTGASIKSTIDFGQSQTIEILSDEVNGTSYLQKNNGILLDVAGPRARDAGNATVTVIMDAGTYASGNIRVTGPV